MGGARRSLAADMPASPGVETRQSGFHVFDILWLDGRAVTSLPLMERRALLSALPLRSPLQRVAALTDPEPWERACREGLGGRRREAARRARTNIAVRRTG